MTDVASNLTDDQKCRQVFPDSFCDLVNGADNATVSNPTGGAPIPASEVQSGVLPDEGAVTKAQQIADSSYPVCGGVLGLPSLFCDYWPYAVGVGVLGALGVMFYVAAKAAPTVARVGTAIYAPELLPLMAQQKPTAAVMAAMRAR